jgi:aminoglycoside phosphotransferase (APT) family kinase protein
MTRVPGRCQPAPSEGDADVWLEQLAEVLVRIHAAPQPSVDLPRFRSWHEPSVIAPAWIRDGGIARAFAARVADGFSGADGPRFIHRDYHPLNVLFDGACISGVVDWVNACVGPIETDIARCRGNIALVAGMGAADRFLRLLGPVGATYDRAWDLDFVASLLGNVDVLLTGNDLGLAMSPRAVRDTLETIVRGALI